MVSHTETGVCALLLIAVMWLMNIHIVPPADSLQCTCMVSHTETGVCALLLIAVMWLMNIHVMPPADSP